VTSPYLNSHEAALYLRFVHADGSPNTRLLREWLVRHRIKTKRRGRSVLVLKAELEASLEDVA
jgi:hypothetical protein